MLKVAKYYVVFHSIIALVCWASAATSAYSGLGLGALGYALGAISLSIYPLAMTLPCVAIAMMFSSPWAGREMLYLAAADFAVSVLFFFAVAFAAH